MREERRGEEERDREGNWYWYYQPIFGVLKFQLMSAGVNGVTNVSCFSIAALLCYNLPVTHFLTKQLLYLDSIPNPYTDYPGTK
jgi:hypothetical protein